MPNLKFYKRHNIHKMFKIKIKILGTRSNNDLKRKLHNGSLPLQVLTRCKDIKLLYPYPFAEPETPKIRETWGEIINPSEFPIL